MCRSKLFIIWVKKREIWLMRFWRMNFPRSLIRIAMWRILWRGCLLRVGVSTNILRIWRIATTTFWIRKLRMFICFLCLYWRRTTTMCQGRWMCLAMRCAIWFSKMASIICTSLGICIGIASWKMVGRLQKTSITRFSAIIRKMCKRSLCILWRLLFTVWLREISRKVGLGIFFYKSIVCILIG